MKPIALLLGCTLVGYPQPATPEVYGYAGVLRAAGDESSLGTGLSWGGGAVIPIRSRMGADIDAGTVKTKRSLGGDDFQLRRTFVGISLVGRWGNERTYFFAGGGGGIENSRRVSIATNFLPGIRPPGAEEISPGIFRFRSSESKPSLIGRAGIVHALSRRILIRLDLLWSQHYVLPNIGVRVGLGYRF